jgi:hypothetical protein
MFKPGMRVVLKGSPGEGEVLHVFGEGAVTVGWDRVGARIYHESQLAPAPRRRRRVAA